MYRTEEVDKVLPAMAKAYAEMDYASKNSKNPHFGNKFASLIELDAASRGTLAKHGLFVSQGVEEGLGGLAMATYIIHGASGQMIGQSVPYVVPKSAHEDPQKHGSATTYSRRYGLQTTLCMIAEDDDGERAVRVLRERDNGETEKSSKERALGRLTELSGEHNLDPKKIEAYVKNEKKAPITKLSSQELNGLVDWLAGDKSARDNFISA